VELIPDQPQPIGWYHRWDLHYPCPRSFGSPDNLVDHRHFLQDFKTKTKKEILSSCEILPQTLQSVSKIWAS